MQLRARFGRGPRCATNSAAFGSRRQALVRASKETATVKESSKPEENLVNRGGLGELGPIGMTVGGSDSLSRGATSGEGDEMATLSDAELSEVVKEEKTRMQSIHTMNTAEWRAKYEKDGAVDLWVEEEFNSGSRLVGGRSVFKGGKFGQGSGEGETRGAAPLHHITLHDRRNDIIVSVDVPEDRYILWEAEDAGLELPYACRMGCCTACAVRVKEGSVWQPEALGISKGLKEQGYALMCVGYPETDIVIETVEEDELYETQFGKSFEAMAVDKNSIFIDRDDFALELAEMDE